MEKFLISGIQQVGIGTENLQNSWKWYASMFNVDVKILQDDTVAERMLLYTGNVPQRRTAAIAVNIQGGGGFEIWQYAERKPLKRDFEIQVGDLGVFVAKLKSRNVSAFHKEVSAKYEKVSPLYTTPNGVQSFYILDPFDNYFQVIQDNYIYIDEKNNTGGCVGVSIGVTNIEASLKLYCDVLGYDIKVYDETGQFPDFEFMAGGHATYRRVLLHHSEKRKGPFSQLFGSSEIELVQPLDRVPRQIYKDRFWGDPGFIQICFDVINMKALKKFCTEKGFPFTIDSCPDGDIFPMGDASGHFTYIEDPDGTLIEFVETHKIPVLKKIGLFINLKKRNREKPLPKFMLKLLALNKVKFS